MELEEIVTADELEEIDKALDILNKQEHARLMFKSVSEIEKMFYDENFMKPGNRNNSTVNLLIHCSIANINPDNIVMCALYTDTVDYDEYIAHKQRIEPYLESWFELGEASALDYTV